MHFKEVITDCADSCGMIQLEKEEAWAVNDGMKLEWWFKRIHIIKALFKEEVRGYQGVHEDDEWGTKEM